MQVSSPGLGIAPPTAVPQAGSDSCYNHDRRVAATRMAVIPSRVKVISRPGGLPDSELVKISRLQGSLLGKGTYGRVYTVAAPCYQELYVLKQSRRRGSEGWDRAEVYSKVLIQEIEQLVQLDHPCIVKCQGGVISKTGVCAVMERLGDDLLSVLCLDRLPGLARRLQLAGDMLDGLCYLHHQQGIGHYDLKCQNVMLSGHGPGRPMLKLIDMDCSGEKLPKRQVASYMDPEAYRVLDEKADVFSAGGVIYSLMAGASRLELWRRVREQTGDLAIRVAVLRGRDIHYHRREVDCDLPDREQNMAASVVVYVVGGCLDLNRDSRLSLREVRDMLNQYGSRLASLR